MLHCGSMLPTSVNAFCASSYSNEWSHATARLNCFCAAGLQDTEKLTVPSFSDLSCRCGCISCANAERDTNAMVNNATIAKMFFFISNSSSCVCFEKKESKEVRGTSSPQQV